MTTVSHGAERQATVFKNFAVSAEPLHRVGHQQYQNLSKKTCMPLVRGPENRHDFASFEEKDSNSFLKFHPHTPPFGPNYPLFPHRDNVPLVDPCSGFVSAGGDADLQPHVGRAIESMVDYSDVKPQQRVPIAGKGARTAHRRHMILQEETSQDRRWNSRAVPAASVRARLGGIKRSWREEKAKDYFYRSNTQKAYEEVPWDKMLPSKIEPPESTVEVMADPVSQCFTKRRYNPEPEISQVIGNLWDRFQTRSFTSPQKPVCFVSRSSRICHIPLYTGCVGAVNFEDIDNANVDLIMFNHVRTSKPRYTSTAHTPNIPGYTGKVHWSATHPANSNPASTSPSIIAQMHGYIAKHGSSSQCNHQGPFSQMVTPVSPQNSFNKTQRETITV
ncbi:protein SPMIP7 [Mergus octosetaceus]